ncbi:hypothetical protein Tc00.1047053508873.370 [Trypanosoma cruzi]|uniref:Uncharacterized protein n=1 Tax=Trypanosoma cruzi (strain CL Brener) TaxID=353153 RepID=Q4E505_TRYCC|nr:hypothetical protein Tc00.1047053508873.370 [Trypanosoma cruzi]EAN99862.1 hypothetical protein Tc00.1047053508873.370 [Trypanosoma cruzi]|eukprot:XP_821713.1 hypothetical protein [Trypanosoma cruzi strain CL Brener]
MFGAAGAPHAESMARWGPDPEKGHRVGRQSSLQRPPPNSDLLAPSAVPLPPLTSAPRTVSRDPAARCLAAGTWLEQMICGRGMCTATRRKKMLRDDHHDKTGVKLCFVHLCEGSLPPGRLGGLFFFFFASLRSLFIPLRFLADLRREICKKFLRGVRAVVGKADSPEKRYLLNLFWAGSSCRFNATLFCGFDACVSERFDLCSQSTRMWCAST